MAFFGMPKLGTAALFRGIPVAIVCSDSSEIGYSERGTNHWLGGKHRRGALAFACPSIDSQLKHDSFQAPSSLVCDKSGGEHD